MEKLLDFRSLTVDSSKPDEKSVNTTKGASGSGTEGDIVAFSHKSGHAGLEKRTVVEPNRLVRSGDEATTLDEGDLKGSRSLFNSNISTTMLFPNFHVRMS